MSQKGVYQLQYQLAEKKKKKEILAFSDFDNATKNLLMKRIHITNDNIFAQIKNIATDDLLESNVKEILDEVVVAEDKTV